jgi:hypothetical protein
LTIHSKYKTRPDGLARRRAGPVAFRPSGKKIQSSAIKSETIPKSKAANPKQITNRVPWRALGHLPPPTNWKFATP